MKKDVAIKKLEKAGFRLVFCMGGSVIAIPNNGGFNYQADSVNGLVKKIFKKLW